MADWQPLIDVLDANVAALPFPTAPAKDAYVTEIKREIEKAQSRENDNKRAATLIAVDAAKTFVSIAVALLGATVGFIQFSYRNVAGLLLSALLFAALLAFISMAGGFIVISRAYKRGDGRVSTVGIPWSTESLRRPLNFQAGAGVVALLIFVSSLAIFTSNIGVPKQLIITLPDGTTSVQSSVKPIT